MDFKTKRRYKFLLRFFAALMIVSSIIGLAIGFYELKYETFTVSELRHIIVPCMIVTLVVLLTSYYQYFRFLNKREAYVRSLKILRQENWQKIIIELADNDELDRAMILYGALNFKETSVRFYLEGYLTAIDKLKNKI